MNDLTDPALIDVPVDFIEDVDAKRGKKLSDENADRLIAQPFSDNPNPLYYA